MTSVLAPAVAVMNRLRFTGKFALVILVLMVAVGALVTLLYIRLDAAIVHSQSELEGLKMIQPLSRAVQSTQQHRGLSAAVLGGNAERKADAAAKAKEIEAHLTQTESLLSAPRCGGVLNGPPSAANGAPSLARE
ncbi:MAG: hypothetical protein IPO00_17655 [Betaproteobacteria bacterium]|nr:hypothetical protein [Betaproteobacteria bacterium]